MNYFTLKHISRLKTKNYPTIKNLFYLSAPFPSVSEPIMDRYTAAVNLRHPCFLFFYLVYIYSDLFMYIYDNAIRMDTWIKNFGRRKFRPYWDRPFHLSQRLWLETSVTYLIFYFHIILSSRLDIIKLNLILRNPSDFRNT